MDKQSVAEFFDRLAPGWDAGMVRSEPVINMILDNAGVSAGKNVLDVACGTGVLIPDYLSRNAVSVCGIDLSPAMAEIARSKFQDKRVCILCGDAEETDFGRRFDCIVIYNAFPHFPDPEHLIERLAGFLEPGGTLTVAHGMSRERLLAHHSGSAVNVSRELLPAEELAEIFSRYLTVTHVISDDSMYQVTGFSPFAKI
jgi:demethylmenaquinone methyltransferase/2-methoxy-6-polyprenyl-1,4-benzoquinol methylase